MNIITSALVAAAVGVLGACAQMQPPPVGGPSTPRYDSTFGDAVRQARAAQTINPGAGKSADPAAGIDAQSARSALERYHDSFKSPPSTFEIIGIGGSTGGGR